MHLECDTPTWRQMLWYDQRLMPGGTQLDFDSIRATTLRPFGLLLRGPTEPGQAVELRFGFSLRGVEQAEFQDHLYIHVGLAAVRHLYKVTASLDELSSSAVYGNS